MPRNLHACDGSTLRLPDTLLCDRQDGAHPSVNPPRAVWRWGELPATELRPRR